MVLLSYWIFNIRYLPSLGVGNWFVGDYVELLHTKIIIAFFSSSLTVNLFGIISENTTKQESSYKKCAFATALPIPHLTALEN